MFTIDTETGFQDIVMINGAWGLGETVVQGRVVPDEFLVAKKMLGTARNPVISKRLGGKHEKMVYARKGSLGPTEIVKTTNAERDSFVLNDRQALQLAKWAKTIEDHYTKKRGVLSPMDIEWGLDGKTNELFHTAGATGDRAGRQRPEQDKGVHQTGERSRPCQRAFRREQDRERRRARHRERRGYGIAAAG